MVGAGCARSRIDRRGGRSRDRSPADGRAREARGDLAETGRPRAPGRGRAFRPFSVELFEHGAAPVVYEIVGQAVRDEVHHAEISVELASKYRGDAPVWPEPEPLHVPPFSPTTGAMHATLYAIAMCCINETVACGVLEAALGQAKSPLVRAALGTILADEIEHARAGWAHVGSPYVTAEMKRVLPKWLRRLHAAKLRELVEDDGPLPGEDFADHGMLSRARSRAVVRATLVDVIFPGFRRAGIDASLAERWAQGAFDRPAARVSQPA